MSSSFSIVVLISGGGTTLKNLIEKRDANELTAEISHVISSNPAASGNRFATERGIPLTTLSHRETGNDAVLSEQIFEVCRTVECDLVVCGGFLRRLYIPADFENRVVNIHPSLIPAFCGKGFYGMKVHQAVVDYGCKVSGCTVHFVDNEFDHGPIISQCVVDVSGEDSAEQVQQRIFAEECQIYPKTINQIAAGLVTVRGRIADIKTTTTE